MSQRRWFHAALATALFAPALTMLAVTSLPAAATTMPDPGVSQCDSLVTTPAGHDCLLPWPNNAFTKKASTPTGREINISPTATPVNVNGVHINPQFENLNDGFSPGSEILINIPNLSLTNSDIAPSTNIGEGDCTIAGKLTSSTAPVVLWDTDTKKCVPYFAELDGLDSDAATQLLMIHPAVNFRDGDRIDVVLRNLKSTSDTSIPQLAGETAALNGTMVPKTRGAHLKWVVDNDLKGWNLTNLYAAWDFSVISAGGTSKSSFHAYDLADPALTMRDQAFKLVGKTAPVFRINSTTTTSSELQIYGAFQVPTFLKNCPTTQTANYDSTDTANCGGMNYSKSMLPEVLSSKEVGGVWTNQIWADFVCVLPLSEGATAALPVVYGHGLLGDASEVAGSSFSEDVAQNMMGCATDWDGMSGNDLLSVAAALNNLSNFHVNVEHMLQGMLNFQFLARLMNSPEGFASNAAFQQDGKSRFQVGKTSYLGYSQGGIMGGAVTALSTQWTRAVLGVAGQNYGGLLLNRSVDWSAFASIYNAAYPDTTDEQVGLQLIQMLWDRGESDGYSENITTNPYEGTPVHQVFITENYGDHQVANVGGESLARTVGAVNHQPAFNSDAFGTPRLNVPVTVQWGIPAASNYAKPMKAFIELWDYGTPTPPTDDEAPSSDAYGSDPHGYGRADPGHVEQFYSFFTTGIIPNICGDAACTLPPG